MTGFAKVAGFAGLLALLFAGVIAAEPKAARADGPVGERELVVTELSSNASAVTYWLREPDGWHVVTTVDTVIGQEGEAEKHAVVRFSAVLLPGQSQLISVPFALGELQQALRIRRLGDQIEVARVPGA